jgi:transcription elongation factor GreA
MADMDKEAIYITQEKKIALEQELLELKSVKRKEILDALEYAKSLGDLSENAEYHQAREEQGKLEERILKIEQILKDSVVMKKHHSTNVEVGSTVKVKKEGAKETQTYQIVGQEEADMATGKISHKSPLGEALFGHKKGDTVSFTTPKATFSYTIVDIE